jgi:hypothetical protein
LSPEPVTGAGRVGTAGTVEPASSAGAGTIGDACGGKSSDEPAAVPGGVGVVGGGGVSEGGVVGLIVSIGLVVSVAAGASGKAAGVDVDPAGVEVVVEGGVEP